MSQGEKPHLWEQYDKSVWEQRFAPSDRQRSRAKAIGDVALDAIMKGTLGRHMNLADLSGDVRGSAAEAAQRFWVKDNREALVDAGHSAVRLGEARCESPIEKHLLPWIVFNNWIFHEGAITPVAYDEAADYEMFVVCQAPVMNYRIDFLVCRRHKGRLERVAIECDGAAFHNAKHDRKRDLDLLRERIFTIRASGREIYNRPHMPVALAEEAFLKLEGCQ